MNSASKIGRDLPYQESGISLFLYAELRKLRENRALFIPFTPMLQEDIPAILQDIKFIFGHDLNRDIFNALKFNL
jgi:hypothetical protein